MAEGHADKWERNYALLEQFYSEFGRFPKQKELYQGAKLGQWCSNQRRDVISGKCLPERYAKLQGIGFLQSRTHDVHWDQHFQMLQNFLAEFGRFPVERDVYHGFNIGKWCSNQKLHAKQSDFPRERMQKLMQIGFFDTTQAARWEQHFAMLEQFVAEFDRMPKRNEVYHDFCIGAWCSEQKRKAILDEYPAHRRDRLREIGLLDFHGNVLGWDQSYALLEEFVAKHHRYPVAKEQYLGYNLGNWCEAQKFLARNTAYPADRLQKLKEIGLFSTTQDAKWERQFAMLEDFVAEFGRLPKQKELYRGQQIGVWCAMQKQRAKKPNYPAERVQKLKEIGLLV